MKLYINTTLFKRAISFALHLIFVVGVFSSLEAAPLRLKVGSINPAPSSRFKPTIQSLSAMSQGMVSGVYIIQSKTVITPAWREALLATGAKIRSYVPENGYLIEADEASLQAILQDISYDNLIPYAPMYKYDTVASTVVRKAKVKASQSSAQIVTTSIVEDASTPFAISLWDAKGQAQLRQVVASHTGCKIIKQDGAVMIATLTGEAIEVLAVLPTVHWIEEYIQPTLFNNVALEPPRMNVTPTWPGGATGWNLTGKGQVVAVCDTGLDTGNKDTLHEDVRGRVSRAYGLGRSNMWDDPDGHGTHVAGSVLGNGANSNGVVRGAAYESTLIFQSVIDSKGYLSGLPADLTSLFLQTYRMEDGVSGARIHTNSWGGTVPGNYNDYTADSHAVDQFLFSHPDMLILFAAGNSGVDRVSPFGVVDPTSIGFPATAKNCLTVGASENQRTSSAKWNKFSFAPIKSDFISAPYQDDIQGMAASSSRGPCKDGRIKPDIVAPGTNIHSLRSNGTAGNEYVFMSGTSMATPLVAGTAALAREWLVKYQNIPNPDGATIKALLMAGAKSLYPGQYGTAEFLEIPTTYPNNVEGWGQVDLVNALGRQNEMPLIFDAQVIAHGETNLWQIQVEQGADLSIILAYTDAPASLPSSRQLVNDLDLLVTTPSGATLYPNSGSSADRINNVEGVRIANAVAGIYTVSVNAHNIPTPMSTTLTDGKANAQRFSLVVNGAQSYTDLIIIGEDSVAPNSTATYTCQVATAIVTPTWSLDEADAPYATISPNGVLTSKAVTDLKTVTLTATYEGKTAVKSVSIIPSHVMVTFYLQDGTGDPITKAYTLGVPYGELPEVQRANYRFDGWFTAVQGQTGVKVEPTTIATAEITKLYAHGEAFHDLVFYPLSHWNAPFFLSNTADGLTPMTAFDVGDTVYFSYATLDYLSNDINQPFTNQITLVENDTMYELIHRIDSLQRGYIIYVEGYAWKTLENLQAGTYTLTCTLNHDRALVETDYLNNKRQITFIVSAPPPIVVPKTWLDQYAKSIENGDYNTAAFKPTGKNDIHGQPLLYWQEYLADTNPKDPTDIFRAYLKMNADGSPNLTWTPDRTAQGTRIYIQEGKTTLIGPWITPPPENANFFRVRVQLP